MHKEPQDFPGIFRELEQLLMVQSGLFFAGPQADHFIMTFASEVGRSLPTHVSFLMKKCKAALERADPRERPRLEQQYKWMLYKSAIWILGGHSHLIPAEQHKILRPNIQKLQEWVSSIVHHLHLDRSRRYSP